MYLRKIPVTRPAFTLVELMVAMALIIFIMYVLAEAFSAGAGAVSHLKAVGDMNERLRGAANLLRRTLQADHFDGRRRLSDRNFWIVDGVESPPPEGFFRILQINTANAYPGVWNEGTDLDLNPSVRATGDALHFTARLRGNKRDSFFQASTAALTQNFPGSRFQEGSNYTSPMAEVAFYLQPVNPVENTVDGGTIRLHTLYMRQRLLVSSNDDVPAAAKGGNSADFLEVSHTGTPGNLYFNNAADVTIPQRRFAAGNANPYTWPTFATENPAQAGNDVVLTDVISFEVRVLLHPDCYGGNPRTFVRLDDAVFAAMTNTTFGTARVFDTWSSRSDGTFDYSGWKPTGTPTATTIPMYTAANGERIRIVAIQVTIRIWDNKTKQARQTSVVVDL
jgi:type II secretory pathway pseudopilin PulG